MDDLSKTMQLHKIQYRGEFISSTKNSNMHCTCTCIERSHLVKIAKHARERMFSFYNNFALSMRFYWSYMLLLKLPVQKYALGAVIVHFFKQSEQHMFESYYRL